MKLRFLSGHFQGRIINLKTSGLSIGRGAESDLTLEGDGASRHHARISFISGRWLIEDLESTNGTRVNGDRISGTRQLQPGDRIGIGDHIMLFSEDNAIADTASAMAIGGESPSTSSIPWGRIAAAAAVTLLLIILVTLYNRSEPAAEPAAAAASDPTALQQALSTAAPTHDSLPEVSSFLARQEAALRDELDMHDIIDFMDLADDRSAANTAAAAAMPVAEPPAPVAPVAPAAPTPPAMPANFTSVAISSEPVQAQLLVNGRQRGRTPIILRDLQPGRYELQFQAPGYTNYNHVLFIPSNQEQLQIELRSAPGSIWLRSTPAGATVTFGSQIIGVTPLLLPALPDDGEHELSLLMHGYEPARQTVRHDPGKSQTHNIALQSRLGTLAVRTSPPGCRVLINNTFKGTTVPADHKAINSKPLEIAGLIEGEHWLGIEHPAGPSRRVRVKVSRGKTTDQSLRLWVPNARVELADGASKIGMLMDINEHGDIVLAETAQRMERYLKPQIANFERLDAGTMQSLISANPDFASGGVELPDLINAKALLEECNTLSSTDLGRKYANRTLTIQGQIADVGEEANQAYITFGDKLRCYFNRNQYQQDEHAIIAAREVNVPITIKGNVIGVMGGRLVLRECAVVTD